MEYFKINGTDLSMYVSGLKISKTATYTAQTNASGNTVIDYINTKRKLDVSIIALDDAAMRALQPILDAFSLTIEYRDTTTGELATVNAILPTNQIEYYTIRADKVMYKALNLSFTEL